MSLRKPLFFFIALLLVLPCVAQIKAPIQFNDPGYDTGRRLRFGFSLGINVMDFSMRNSVAPEGEDVNYFADVSSLIPGFNVNGIADFRLSENFHLRTLPGLAFGQRNIDFYVNGTESIEQLKVESSFIEVPLMIKYSAVRTSNFRPYLIAGTNFRIDMAAYKKLNYEDKVWLKTIKGDIYYEFGFGLDFFLQYFKFSTEIKWSSGFLNVLTRDYLEEAEGYVNAIDHMQSQLLVISFHFE